MRMEPLPGFAVRLFLFAGCMEVISAVKQVEEDIYKVAGSQSFSLSLPTSYTRDPSDILTWKYGKEVVHQSGTVKNKYKMDSKGGLELPTDALHGLGTLVYSLEVHNKDGQETFKLTSRIHLLEEVKTPNLTSTCEGEEVVFNCTVTPTINQMKFAWSVDNFTKKTGTIIKLPQEFEESVKCMVYNNASKKQSLPVTANCKTFYHLISEWSTYIAAGAGGLLLLIILIIIICCVQVKRRRRNRKQMESELRLEWTNQTPKPDVQQKQRPKKKRKQHPQSGSQPHRCKHSGEPHKPKDPSAPAAYTSHPPIPANPPRPRASPRQPVQERDSTAVGGVEYCPPLPKPRKKAPKTNTRGRM